MQVFFCFLLYNVGARKYTIVIAIYVSKYEM